MIVNEPEDSDLMVQAAPRLEPGGRLIPYYTAEEGMFKMDEIREALNETLDELAPRQDFYQECLRNQVENVHGAWYNTMPENFGGRPSFRKQ